MEIKEAGLIPTGPGPEEYFTGSVLIQRLLTASDPARVEVAKVTFAAGARTAWHTHPLGQTLIITEGKGWAQRWGGPVEELKEGDVVWFPPDEKHWHGAQPNIDMTHIAIQERQGAVAVKWLEHVTEEQYRI